MAQQNPGQSIFNNLRPLAAIKQLEQKNQESIIYPLRKPKPPQQNLPYYYRPQQTKGDLFFNPINHDGGNPKCVINMQDYKENGLCENCKKNFSKENWYYDLTLALIIMSFRNNQNKKDIIECVKFYKDGEYEILYQEYDEAVETDKYLANDPIVDELIAVQEEIVQRVANQKNVILEQNPELIERFTQIIEQALQ